MKWIFPVLLAISTALASAAHAALVPATVRVHKDTIFYDGDIIDESVRELIALYDHQKIKPTLITIRSPGGDAGAGLDFGEFVHAHRLSVRVMDYCMSSCANYVFPAAIRKQLSRDAVVVWHGGVNSMQFGVKDIEGKVVASFRCQSPDTCAEEFAKRITAEYPCSNKSDCAAERARLEAANVVRIRALAKRENEFFDAIGIDKTIVVYGQEVAKCNCNWTFRVEDLSHFKVNDVVVEKERGWYDWSWKSSIFQASLKRRVVVLAVQK